jgi:hypothetical protein
MSVVLDEELRYNNVEDEMLQMLQLALACVDSVPDRRPKMDEVVLLLLLEDITGHDDENSFRAANHTSRACTPRYVRPSSGVFVIAH